MTKVLVCGYGSIGKKHAAHLKELGAEIRIWRVRGPLSSEDYDFTDTLEGGIDWCDGLVVATATDQHIEIACQAANARKAIYIEKPLSHNRDSITELKSLSEGLVIEVGCQLRFHPNMIFLHNYLKNETDGKIQAFQAWVGQRLDQWRPQTDYRQSYSADASRGGGALFDLVHEVDLIAWLAGRIDFVSARLSKTSNLEIKSDDLANLILGTKSGASGVIQLDTMSPAYRRGLSLVCEKAVISWDFVAGVLSRNDGAGFQDLHVDLNKNNGKTLLKLCMAYFLNRMSNPSIPPSCSLDDAIHDLDILLAARESSEHGVHKIL